MLNVRSPDLARINAEILKIEIQIRKTEAPELAGELKKLVKARNALVENFEKNKHDQPKWTRLQYGDNVEIRARDTKETHTEHLFECIATAGASMRDAQLVFVSNAPYREKEIYTLKFPDGTFASAMVESVTVVAAIKSSRVVFRVL